MPESRILNTREVKQIKELVKDDFGFFPVGDYVFLQNNQNKIFLVNIDLGKLDLKCKKTESFLHSKGTGGRFLFENLIVDKFGFYFGELKDRQFRLSKEGAQLLFLKARENKVQLKNVLALTEKETKDYFLGLDLEKDLGIEGRPLILTFDNQGLGAARYKDKKILNFLPKIHRGEVIL